jgi:hypothetical protein
MQSFKLAGNRIYQFVYYKLLLFGNHLKRIFTSKASNPAYLFILAPPFTGSTLVTEILLTSSNTSINNPIGNHEGQQLPELKKLLWEKESKVKYDPSVAPDWRLIKIVWHRYWDLTRPVLVQKSPPDIARAAQLEKQFSPAYFFCLVRNPYAQCESHIRRNSFEGNVVEIAEFVAHCLHLQRQNISTLPKLLFFTYEELTDVPEIIQEKLIAFLPVLSDISVSQTFQIRHVSREPKKINNRNESQISNLTATQISAINSVFNRHLDLLTYFGYSIIQ